MKNNLMYYDSYFLKINIPDWQTRQQGLYQGLLSKKIDTTHFTYFDPCSEEINDWGYGIHDYIVSQSFFHYLKHFQHIEFMLHLAKVNSIIILTGVHIKDIP